MKFSVFAATAALMCAMVSAGQTDEVGAVKGVPIVIDSAISIRSAQFVKGEAIIHSRSEDLATSKIAVPDSSNPYVKVKGTGDNGIVAEALSVSDSTTTKSSSSSAWTIPVAVGGCAVAAIGIAGFVFMKKRKQAAADDNVDEAKTPANSSPQDELVEYNTDMETPV